MASVEPIVVKSFSRALLEVIKKDEMPLDEAQAESRQLRQVLKEQPKFKVFLEGPQFRDEDKKKVVENSLKGQLSEVFYRFMLLLLRRDRIVFLNDILLELEELIEREKGVVPGVVVTAVPLSEEEQHTLKTKLEEFCKQNFVFRWKVDPDIIGGIRVKYEDKLIDSTIATFLGDLRTRLKSTRLAS